jgi:hypothetical protein
MVIQRTTAGPEVDAPAGTVRGRLSNKKVVLRFQNRKISKFFRWCRKPGRRSSPACWYREKSRNHAQPAAFIKFLVTPATETRLFSAVCTLDAVRRWAKNNLMVPPPSQVGGAKERTEKLARIFLDVSSGHRNAAHNAATQLWLLPPG